MNIKQINFTFYLILFAYTVLLIIAANSLAISSKEINIFYNDEHSFLWYLTHISTHFLGTTNIGLRAPFIFFFVLSVLIAYILTQDYFTRPIDKLISISIFMLLPGFNSAALLVDISIVVIFCTLLYLYLFKLYGKEYYLLLLLYLFIDNSFAILYFALFLYSFQKNDKLLLSVSLTLFIASLLIYEFFIGGHPRGYFLDTFAIYASVFSPIVFLYFFYTLYRVVSKGEKDLYWYIAFTSLILSLLLSLRQKIDIADFAPYLVIAVPLMVKTFLHSYRVRLKTFRLNHKIFAYIMMLILLLNTSVLLFNKPLYLLMDNHSKHFAYKFHIADELAFELKKLGIVKIDTYDKKLAKRLDYYGVTYGNQYFLTDKKSPIYHKKIEIRYFNKSIKKYYILLQK
jgi:hypothetical protein